MSLISNEFAVIGGFLMHRTVSNPEGTTQLWACVVPSCPARGQNSMGCRDHREIETHTHAPEQLKNRLVVCSETEAHPFEIVWTALADGESIPKLLITTPNGLILEWRRIMTRRKGGVAVEFYRCISCELNNLHKGEKLPHLCVDATKPTARTLLTDPEMIRHICCEATYIPMNFPKTGALLNSSAPQEEEINFHSVNNFKEEMVVSREPSEPPQKKVKLEERGEPSSGDIWSDFGQMIASMTRRTATRNLDRAFQLQQGIFRLLHEFGENNHTV
ncbi:hypothetical protein QR680_017000 [Steinernema hermaphroditum]|uniref:Uncharacterized protein n=1 Tax=Steinernema hermaphroditum TaxID=289476 RepID=A0AA39HCZ2_9BILA|nr:hypothetical protein QR680_017000 [Steinernema hermaphroditum]